MDGASGHPGPADAHLRRLEPHNFGFAYDLAYLMPGQWLRVTENGLPNPHQFEHLLFDRTAEVFSLHIPDERGPVGIAAVSDASFLHGTAHIELVLEPNAHPRLGATAASLLLDWVFNAWPLRKVYCRYATSGPNPLASIGDLAVEEARLPEAYFESQIYWDVIWVAVWGDQWRRHRMECAP